MFELTTLKV